MTDFITYKDGRIKPDLTGYIERVALRHCVVFDWQVGRAAKGTLLEGRAASLAAAKKAINKAMEQIPDIQPVFALKKTHDDKELIKHYLVIADDLNKVIDARLYTGRGRGATRVYCDVFLYKDGLTVGSADAWSNYMDDALGLALRDAGLDFTHCWHGRAVKLLELLAKQLTAKKVKVFT